MGSHAKNEEAWGFITLSLLTCKIKFQQAHSGCTPPKWKGSIFHSCLTRGGTKKGSGHQPSPVKQSYVEQIAGWLLLFRFAAVQLPRFEVDLLVSVSLVLQMPLTSVCWLGPVYVIPIQSGLPLWSLFKRHRVLDWHCWLHPTIDDPKNTANNQFSCLKPMLYHNESCKTLKIPIFGWSLWHASQESPFLVKNSSSIALIYHIVATPNNNKPHMSPHGTLAATPGRCPS